MALIRLSLGLIIVFYAVISSECKYVMPFHRRKGRLGIKAPTLSSVSFTSQAVSESEVKNSESGHSGTKLKQRRWTEMMQAFIELFMVYFFHRETQILVFIRIRGVYCKV